MLWVCEQVKVVHDFSAWLKPNVGHFEQIKSARYFVIARRAADGEPVMWYKPNSAHEFLYPSLKDTETGMPVHEIVDGARKYKTDMAGIEVLKELPRGVPSLQPFEEERLDLHDIYSNVQKIMDLHPQLFDNISREWWRTWYETTSTNAEDAVASEFFCFDWPRKAGEWKPPTLAGLQSEYQETITYINTKGQQAFRPNDARQAASEQSKESPVLAAQDLLLLKSGEDAGMHRLPFWIAEVNEPVRKDQNSIPIVWRSAFKSGQMADDVNGQWSLVCKGSCVSRGGKTRYHPYTNKCSMRGKDKIGHGMMHGVVQREEVALYFPKLTAKSNHMCAVASNTQHSQHACRLPRLSADRAYSVIIQIPTYQEGNLEAPVFAR